MDMQKESNAYLATLVQQEAITQDEFKDIAYKPEINAFHSKYLSSHYVDNVNWGWNAWQAAKASAVPEWIDISDRLPDEGQEVFVHHFGQIKQATKDKNYYGGFKSRNCYGWECVSGSISHWMPKSIKLPESFHFYYEHDAKDSMLEAQEPSHD